MYYYQTQKVKKTEPGLIFDSSFVVEGTGIFDSIISAISSNVIKDVAKNVTTKALTEVGNRGSQKIIEKVFEKKQPKKEPEVDSPSGRQERTFGPRPSVERSSFTFGGQPSADSSVGRQPLADKQEEYYENMIKNYPLKSRKGRGLGLSEESINILNKYLPRPSGDSSVGRQPSADSLRLTRR